VLEFGVERLAAAFHHGAVLILIHLGSSNNSCGTFCEFVWRKGELAIQGIIMTSNMVAEPGGSPGAAASGTNVPVPNEMPGQGSPFTFGPPDTGSAQRSNSEPRRFVRARRNLEPDIVLDRSALPGSTRNTQEPAMGQTNPGNPMPNGMNPHMMLWMQQFMTAMFQGMNQQQQEQVPPRQTRFPRDEDVKDDKHKRVVLDEKYFRRIDKFDGDFAKFRAWLFDLLVSIGQVDNNLAKELKLMLSRKLDEKWDPEFDPQVDLTIYENIRLNFTDCYVP
jgi:hypothetical protein